MSTPAEVNAAARSIADRLRVAESRCEDRNINPYRESPTLPIVIELAEVVAALAAHLDAVN